MKSRIAVLVLAGLGFAGSASAQAFDVPSFMPPHPGDDIGGYLTTQGDFGIQGIWRQQGNLNLGLRFGYVDYDRRDGAITIGAETWGEVMEAGRDFPLDITWTLGIGAGFNGGTLFEVPVGLSLGRVLDTEFMPIQVYGHPRIALAVFSNDAGDDTDLEFLFDLGADFHFNPEWKFRVGATLGDAEAFGVGLAYRWSRGAVVR